MAQAALLHQDPQAATPSASNHSPSGPAPQLIQTEGNIDFSTRFAPKLTQLLEFVQDVLPLLNASHQPSTATQKLIHNNTDFLMPFRQHAYSIHALEDSFLHPNHIRQPGAWVSLVMWRAVFFRTPFFTDHLDALWFKSEQEWTTLYQQLLAQGKEKLYFCLPNAYGTMTKRSPDSIPVYWRAEARWNEALKKLDGGKMEFWDCFKLLNSNSKSTGGNFLPQAGDLTCMLLAGDLCYAGVVKIPDCTEMSKVIHKLDKGALSAMKGLGFFPDNSKPSCTEVTSTFTSIYLYLEKQLSDEQRRHMIFDTIMVEHLLCKFQRCLRLLSHKSKK